MSRLVKTTGWFCLLLFLAIAYPALVAHQVGLAWGMVAFAFFSFTCGIAFDDMMNEAYGLQDELEDAMPVDAEEAKWRKLLEYKPSEYGAGRQR